MEFGVVSVSAITVIAFLAGFAWKTASKLDNKWIPIICGSVGLILGVVSFIIHVPSFPGENIIDAAAIGIVSGFAAVGIHQLGKQLK